MKERFLSEGDDLGLPWERWSDGLPHRLRRNRDFPDIEPELVREAAKVAARRMGMGVQAAIDRMSVRKGAPSKALWVQFTDHEIRLGDPCKCGGRRIVRIHPSFARCDSCGASLVLAPPKSRWKVEKVDVLDEDEEEEIAEIGRTDPEALLREFRDVHLRRVEHVEGRETYRGYARLGDEPALLLVQFRADPGERISNEEAYDRAAAVQVVPLRQIRDVVDRDALMDPAAGWDLVL